MRGIAAALCTSYAPCPCPGEALVPAGCCSLAQPFLPLQALEQVPSAARGSWWAGGAAAAP